MENKNIIKRVITILLGLSITLARIIYPRSVNITKTTVIIEFLMELVICSLIIFINRKELKEIFSKKIDSKKDFIKNVIIIWAIMFFGETILQIIAQGIYGLVASGNLNEAYDPANEIGSAFIKSFFLPVLLVQCIIAPIEEEMVFRYTFRKIFSKNNILNIILFVLLSSWLFGFIHSAALFTPGMITYICTGIVLALAYLKYKDIRLLICAHACYNILLWLIQLITQIVNH